MLAGGTEAAISRLGVAGFNACRALSTAFNDNPEAASRPFDRFAIGCELINYLIARIIKYFCTRVTGVQYQFGQFFS